MGQERVVFPADLREHRLRWPAWPTGRHTPRVVLQKQPIHEGDVAAATSDRILYNKMNEPPAALLWLARFLGGEPRRVLSHRRSWFLLVLGAVGSPLCALGLFISAYSTYDLALPAMAVDLGLGVAAQGTAGLLRESREGLSLWLSVLSALLLTLYVLLVEAYLYVIGARFLAGLLLAAVALSRFDEWVQYRAQR